MPVTQADRDFVANHMTRGVRLDAHDLAFVNRIRAGDNDGHLDVQAAARHRIVAAEQARAEERERAVAKCLWVSGMIGAANGSSIDSALREAAAAIRAGDA